MKYRVEKVDALLEKTTILNLWKQNFPGLKAEQRFVWMYEGNPAGVPDVWFLISPDNDCVGMLGVRKRQFCFAGTELKAGEAIDFVINKKHRILGPALELQRDILAEVNEGRFDFIYGFPNKQSKNVKKRAGFVEYGVFQRKTLVLLPSYVLCKYSMNKKLAAFAGKSCDILFRAKHIFFSRQKTAVKQSFLEMSEIGTDLDVIWKNGGESGSIVGERDTQYLKWRFGEFSLSFSKCFLIRKENVPHGYIIYQCPGEHVFIADFMTDQPEWLKPLFKLFARSMVKKNYMSISIDCINTPFVDDFLHSIGFVKRPTDHCVYVAAGKSLQKNNALTPESLFLTVADRDV